MSDEAQAYICFCALMKRLNFNFMLDGIAMTLKFTHLSEALQFYDPEFYDYLKLQQADDLLFCYRWLLLEMKREFAFEDSLRMLEVLWSSLPPEPPIGELKLFEKEFTPPPVDLQPPPKSPSAVVMRTPRENPYTKLCALRRQSSSQSLIPLSPNALKPCDVAKSLDLTKRLNQSLDENIARNSTVTNKTVSKSYQSLDESKMQWTHQNAITRLEVEKNEKNQQISRSASPSMRDEVDTTTSNDNCTDQPISPAKTCLHSNHVHRAHHHNVKQHSNHGTRRTNNNGSGHFKDLKKRLAAGKKGIFASFDKIESFQLKDLADANTNSIDSDECHSSKSEKVVKNFNEFLNFASNKSVKLPLNKSNSLNVDDKCARPTLQFAKSSFDESDSSSAAAESNSLNQTDKEQNNEVCANRTALQLQLSEKKQLTLDCSSPDDSQEYFPMTTSITRELRLELDSLNRQVFGNHFATQFSDNRNDCAQDDDGNDVIECNSQESNDSHISNNKSPAIRSSDISYTKLNQNSTEVEDEHQLDKIYRCPSDKNVISSEIRLRNKIVVEKSDEAMALKRASTVSGNADVFVWENPLHQLSPTIQNNNSISATVAHISINENNPFFAKDFIQTLTPDEQNDLEYDGEIIDESCTGKKSITPIRLLRKYIDESGTSVTAPVQSNNSSKRNSTLCRNDTDSDSSADMSINDNNQTHTLQNVNMLMKTSTISETNPFLMDIVSSIAAANVSVPNCVDDNMTSLNTTPVDEEATEANIALRKVGTSLPSPTEFGGGNPFLMFLCLTLLLQHRNYVMKNNMDYNEMAMHFDKMVRKHNVIRVLNQARRMYAEYLKSQNVHHAVGGSNRIDATDYKMTGDNVNVNSNSNKQKLKNDIRA